LEIRLNSIASQIAEQLGVEPTMITETETLSIKHGHNIWRIKAQGHSYILKYFPEEQSTTEVQAYELLQELGVPTLPVYTSTSQALLLEDLTTSSVWRLADQQDVADPDVGEAVARWFIALHEHGVELLSVSRPVPQFLTREIDKLDKDSIISTGKILGLKHHPVWRLAADYIDLLKKAASNFPETLNYNDFHWTNLALSRSAEPQMEAVIFDYHLLGIGMHYCDYRNVTGSLHGDAVPVFQKTYGDIDVREETLDKPLATLFNLVSAAALSEFPSWAQGSRKQVIRGELERDIREAVELAGDLV